MVDSSQAWDHHAANDEIREAGRLARMKTADPKTAYVILYAVPDDGDEVWRQADDTVDAASSKAALLAFARRWGSGYTIVRSVAVPVRSFQPRKPVADTTPRWSLA
jgi:hypothetical protein